MKRTSSKTGQEYWLFWCPGCETHHSFRTKLGLDQTGPVWTKTGSDEKPTFAPSLLIYYRGLPKSKRCHLFLRNGMVQYLNDCTHKFKGKTIPVQEPC